MVDHNEVFSSTRRDRYIQKVDMDKIAETLSKQYNMSVDEFNYYLMKILICDTTLATEFSDLMVSAKLIYSDDVKDYTDMIAKMTKSFKQQDILLKRIQLEEELLKIQYSLITHVEHKNLISDA